MTMEQYETSLDAYNGIIAMTRRLASVVGADVLQENYRPNFGTGLTLLAIVSYILAGFYSVWYYYPDTYQILQALAPIGIACQGLAKLYCAVVHRKFFQQTAKFLEDFHRSNGNHQENNAILLRLTVKMHFATRLLMAGYSIAIASYSLYPLYFYVCYGERILALDVVVPGLDPHSQWGYLGTMLFHMFLLLIAMTGISASDTVILLFICSLAGLADVFMIKLKELDTILEAPKRDVVLIREHLRDLIADHKRILSYESDLNERYVVIIFVQVASSVSCLTLALYLCYKNNYLPGYGFFVGALFQLLEFCLLGAIFSVKNEELIIAIYNTKWYLLDTSPLKSFHFMFHRSQNTKELTIAGLAPLNVETFVEIMKTIYQIFAMMISFTEN